jgi:hypothetical protein
MAEGLSFLSIVCPLWRYDGCVFVLYRFFDGQGALLYIGLTCGFRTRMAAHRRQKDWWVHVARIELERFPDKASVVAAELAAIKHEKPRYNIVHGRRVLNGRSYSERHERRLRRGR